MRELTYSTPKPRRGPKSKGWRARQTAKKKRAESPVIKAVRAKCVERDGDCRICDWENNPDDTHEGDGDDDLPYPTWDTAGPSEWAHLGEGKRHKTRNMKPEQRHSTKRSLMLCKFHHDRYDGRQHPRIAIKELTELGADGPLDITTIE